MAPRVTTVLAILGVGAIATIGDVGSAPTARAPGRARGARVAPILVPMRAPGVVELPSPPPVAGWLVDAAGTPIAGVAVARRDPAGGDADAIARSEADGAFRTDRLAAGDNLSFDAADIFPADVAWRGAIEPPRIMLARRAQIDAHVVVGATPVAGAEVHLSDGSGPILATVTTDDRGVARFSDVVPGPYELWARQGTWVSPVVHHEAGAAPAEARAPPVPAEVALALAPGGSVHGHATGAAAGTVVLVPIDLDHAARVVAIDGHGRFAIDGVPFGTWRVLADAPGYAPAVDQVELVAGRAHAELALALEAAGVVTGTVIDATGAPVPNATVVLRPQGGTPTDPRPTAPAPTSRLRWVHPLAGERQLPIRDARRFGASRAGVRPAECGRGHCGNDLGTERGAVVHAAADGEVIAAFTEIRKQAGRYVALLHAGGMVTFYMHLDELRADLEPGLAVRAGEPIGTVGTTGFGKLNPHLHFAIAQERSGRRWYVDPEPILRHAVVLPVARPLTAAEPRLIAAIRAGGSASPTGSPTPTPPPSPLVTDAAGRFRIHDVTPGTYVAAAFDAALAPGTSAAFRVAAGAETDEVAITLAPGVVVRGRVFGRDGAVRGARVVAEEGTGEATQQVAAAYTDHDGAFALRSLAGTVTLSVGAAGHGQLERTIDLDGAGDHRREDFELAREDARLHGQVVAPDGRPAAAVITIVDGATRHRRVATDAAGRFAIEAVARGRYVVELGSDDHPSTRATLDTDTWRELRLAPAGRLRVEVCDAHTGAAVPGVVVEVTGPGPGARPVTDAAGAASLRALVPGAWTVRVRARGYVVVARVLDVRARATPDVVRIELARGATLAGIVRDRFGERVAGARVTSGTSTTRTDRDGGFRLVDVPTGAVRIEAEHDTARGGASIQIAPGDELVTLALDVAE